MGGYFWAAKPPQNNPPFHQNLELAYNEAMADEMKKCKYCGREIGKDTTFCWYCGRELEARPERPEVQAPESRTPRWVWLVVGVVVLLVVAYFLLIPLFR
jgi:hypothetical protein